MVGWDAFIGACRAGTGGGKKPPGRGGVFDSWALKGKVSGNEEGKKSGYTQEEIHVGENGNGASKKALPKGRVRPSMGGRIGPKGCSKIKGKAGGAGKCSGKSRWHRSNRSGRKERRPRA